MPRATWIALLAVVSLASIAPRPVVCAVPITPGEDVSGQIDTGERIVAVGQLRQDDGTHRGKTGMVLVGENGEICAHLSATPGVDLEPYLGRTVGVTARVLASRPGLAPRLLVEEVSLLDGGDPISDRQDSDAPKPNSGRRSEDPTDGPDDAVTTADYTTPIDDDEPIGSGLMPYRVMPTVPMDLDFEYLSPPLAPLAASGPLWFRAEYLGWWTDGMDLPALVTSSSAGTPRDDAGVLGRATTTVRLGRQDVLTSPRSGVRAVFRSWFRPERSWGVEGEYLGLEGKTRLFLESSGPGGSPILARPFFNINPRVDITGAADPPARQDAELIAFPNVSEGTVAVSASNTLDSAGVRGRLNLYCERFGYEDPCIDGYSRLSRLDLVFGYRFLRFKERLIVSERLTSLEPTIDQQFDIADLFRTRNEFNGAELGAVWEGAWHRWTWECLGKFAVGNVHQLVVIQGETVVTPAGGAGVPFDGGLLAQRSNAGGHSRDEFTIVPEMGITLGYRIAPRLRTTIGYSFLYWSRVVRPGQQMDLDLNPGLLPPERDDFTGPLRPRFAFRDTDFWAQGLNFGLDYSW